MARHVCGTCRFFRAREPKARSGWCGHPQRQTTTDVHILVRGGELNCRNDWDKDLWQLREDGDRVLDVSMVKLPDDNDRLRSPQPVEPRRTLGHDSPSVAEPLPPPDDFVIADDADAPRLVSEDINREMIRRAREEYRARRQTTRPDGPTPRPSDVPSPMIHRAEPIVISNEVQPHQINAEARQHPTRAGGRDRPALDAGATSQAARGAFSSVPEIEDTIALPHRTTRRPDVVPTVDDYEMTSLRTYDEVVQEDRARRYDETPPARLTLHPRDVQHEMQVADEESDDLGDGGREGGADREGETAETAHLADWDDRSIPRHAAPPGAEESWESESDDLRPWSYVEPRRPRSGDQDVREVVRMLPPSRSRLWEGIPRCCRTCRDFRAAESGGNGGWCTNKWAFRHRRMVDVDRLTCETTIGDWWLPTDDAWQDDFDVGRHTLSTPLMDKWFGRPEEDSEAYVPMVASRTRRGR